MITISSNNGEVIVEIVMPYPTSHTFSLRIEAGTSWMNRLLGHTMREVLDRRLAKIREGAYAHGWKDAKAKRVKRKHFPGGWGE